MPVPAPQPIVEAFALNGLKRTIPVPTQLPGNPGNASFNDGFPAATFQPLTSGGQPMSGYDMNGILNMLSQYCANLQAGQGIVYDASTAAAIGGYAVGALLQNVTGTGWWFNIVADNETNPDLGGAGWIAFTGGITFATPAEEAVSAVIVNANALPGNWVRYGADPTGVEDSTAAGAFAVAQSLQPTGANVYVPGGTFLTTASIPQFHSAVKYGPGFIKRGTVTFAVVPQATQTNNLYVSTGGVDTNDGLGSGQPMLTNGAACTAVNSYQAMLNGFWTVNFANGTYKNGGAISAGIQSVNPITFTGPAVTWPNAPGVIFDGSFSPTTNYGIYGAGKNKIYVSYIMFQHWRNSGLGFGVVCQDFAEVETFYVWGWDCDCPIKSQQGRLYAGPGEFWGNTNAIISISQDTHSIGNFGGVNSNGFTTATVASASGNGTTATLVFPTQIGAPRVGSYVQVLGMTPSGYNTLDINGAPSGGIITASTTNSISYACTATGAMTGTPGTVSFWQGCNSVNAGSFVIGNQYTITSVGTTNFVAIGAASNTVGVTFTATGVGSGTGTAVGYLVGPHFYANSQGLLIQENATGHFDYATVANCGPGIDLICNSRANCNNAVIVCNATAGVRLGMNSSWARNGVTMFGNANDTVNHPFSEEINFAGMFASRLYLPVDNQTLLLTGICGHASFTGSIAGTALSTSGVTGTITIGQNVAGPGVAPGTVILWARDHRGL